MNGYKNVNTINAIYQYLFEKYSKFFNKVLKEKQHPFNVYLLVKNSKGLIICVTESTHDHYIYGKIASLEEMMLWDCNYVLESPQGLFLFAKTINEFLTKLDEKIQYLMSVSGIEE